MMRTFLPVHCLALALFHLPVFADPPTRIVFDTDIAGDVDDVLALAMLHALADRRECTIEAVTVSKTHPLNGPMVDAVNTFYGRPDVPIGVTKGQYPRESKYLDLVTRTSDGKEVYPHDLARSSDAPDAVQVLRNVLAKAPPRSITIVPVGLAVNLADLLESAPDATSPLSGRQLVRQKVKLVSVMAGAFSPVNGNQRYLEANVRNDVSSMQRFVANWPEEVPVVWSDFNIGIRARYPRESIERDFRYRQDHIVRESYLLHSGPDHDRPSWDLTSVLYAVRPTAGYFDVSAAGRVKIADDGFTTFTESAAGPHRYLQMNEIQAARVVEVQRTLVSQPPVTEVLP